MCCSLAHSLTDTRLGCGCEQPRLLQYSPLTQQPATSPRVRMLQQYQQQQQHAGVHVPPLRLSPPRRRGDEEGEEEVMGVGDGDGGEEEYGRHGQRHGSAPVGGSARVVRKSLYHGKSRQSQLQGAKLPASRHVLTLPHSLRVFVSLCV